VTGEPAIVARGWGWRHAGRRAWALRGVDLRVERGERVLLLGPSGSGKSTLLHAFAGLLDPGGGGEPTGSLLVDGEDPRRARDRVGLVFQDPDAQIVMGRAGDDVAFGLENRCVPTDRIWPTVDRALDAVGWRYGRDRSTGALSGGERQRLALAGALALRPAILLLDEPTANLDPPGAASFREVLAGVLDDAGVTMVLVEHRVDESIHLVDRVVVLEAGGGVVADGHPDEVFATHGDRLAEAGVWVPGRAIEAPKRRSRPAVGAERLLAADELRFRYPGAAADALAVASVEVWQGEALAVTGPNGSGKSTLALLLAGLLRPTAGQLTAGPSLAGDRADPPWRWPARHLVRRIGTVFQNPEHQFLTGSVRDELTLGPTRAGATPVAARARTDELLERLHLAGLARANPFTLSGGEQRRLSVATALATAPAVLVLDEPTFGQDRRTWGELLHLLAALRDDGRAICCVSHDLAFVDALADRTLTLTTSGSPAGPPAGAD
jgi:energy-coupling factor transporter ATP-binding protein EcfA2